MNSPNSFDHLDMLFQQAFQPPANMCAPEGIWRRVKAQVQQPALPRWRRVLGGLGRFQCMLPVLSDVNELFPSEIRLLAITGLLQEQRRMTLLMA